jgi:hypothetical protein
MSEQEKHKEFYWKFLAVVADWNFKKPMLYTLEQNRFIDIDFRFNTRRSKIPKLGINFRAPMFWLGFVIIYFGSNEGDYDISFGLECFFSISFSFGNIIPAWVLRKSNKDRCIALQWNFKDWSFDWDIWSEVFGSYKEIPRWQMGKFFLLDFVFGKKQQCSYEIEEEARNIEVVGGEGVEVIRGEAMLFEECISRPRSPLILAKKYTRIKLKQPIPIQGKGECEWDCGNEERQRFHFRGDVDEAALQFNQML